MAAAAGANMAAIAQQCGDREAGGPSTGFAKNSIAYVGCSMANNIGNGNKRVGNGVMWNSDNYGTGAMVVQNWTSCACVVREIPDAVAALGVSRCGRAPTVDFPCSRRQGGMEEVLVSNTSVKWGRVGPKHTA
jgi:hypothetical protein